MTYCTFMSAILTKEEGKTKIDHGYECTVSTMFH
jgi:hypothetical protein